jgi:tetratricopeptide (TPR) repeat protein
MTGCVVDGIMFSLPKSVVKAGAAPETGAEWLQVFPSSVNLAPYEGKKIRARGLLRPGDVFQPDLKTIEIIGTCSEEDRLAIGPELAQAYGGMAEERASQEDWSKAWNYINKAIKLDNSNCSLFLTRSKFYKKQGKFAEAVRDAQQAVQSGCDRYPDLAILAELLERVGKKAEASAAYEQAIAACEYKPDKESLQQSLNRLKSDTHTDTQKQGSQAQGKELPTAMDPGALPPPPPMPD